MPWRCGRFDGCHRGENLRVPEAMILRQVHHHLVGMWYHSDDCGRQQRAVLAKFDEDCIREKPGNHVSNASCSRLTLCEAAASAKLSRDHRTLEQHLLQRPDTEMGLNRMSSPRDDCPPPLATRRINDASFVSVLRKGAISL
jgi:hypothetical protein